MSLEAIGIMKQMKHMVETKAMNLAVVEIMKQMKCMVEIRGDESRSRRDYEANEMYGGNKGDESRSHRDYEANEMYGGKMGDESKSRRDYETNEASRTYGFGSKKGRGLRKAFTPNRNKVYKESIKTKKTINEIVKISKQLQTENRSYKVKNKEYREALKIFRSKLNEVAVFNANLAYSTKLFTEHTTTKKEKINILRRFDNVSTLNESKSLYKQITSDLNIQTKSLKETVQKTITKTPFRGVIN